MAIVDANTIATAILDVKNEFDDVMDSMDDIVNRSGWDHDHYLDTEHENTSEMEQVVYAVVTGLCCTILFCVVFMPLAKKWDMFITKRFAGRTVFVVQHIDQDQSSHLSDIVMSDNDADATVTSENFASLKDRDAEKDSHDGNDHESERDDDGFWVLQMVHELTKFECTNMLPSIQKACMVGRTALDTCEEMNRDHDDDSPVSHTLCMVTSEDMMMSDSFRSDFSSITDEASPISDERTDSECDYSLDTNASYEDHTVKRKNAVVPFDPQELSC